MSEGAVSPRAAKIFGVVRRVIRRFESERHHDGESIVARWDGFTFSAEEDELDGGWVAECRQVPGCVGQGDTRDEAVRDAADALLAILEVRISEAFRDSPNGPEAQGEGRGEFSVAI